MFLNVSPLDGSALKMQLHARGINLRYLGKIATLAANRGDLNHLFVRHFHLLFVHPFYLSSIHLLFMIDPFYLSSIHLLFMIDPFLQRLCISEMILRTTRRKLRKVLLNTPLHRTAAAIAHVLNCFLVSILSS